MFKVLWNLECPIGLSPKGICVHLVKEIWCNFDGPLKGTKTGAMECFGIIRPKVAQIVPCWW